MRSVFDVYLEKEDSPGNQAYASLALPAMPYEIMDALERVRPDIPPYGANLVVEEYNGFDYLAPYIVYQSDLCGLNALAEKLSELTEEQAIALRGLVKIEAVKPTGPLTLQRLLDLAYSTDCCHVVDALNDSQLGRFYAENGFVPEVENLPDNAFKLLDFDQIGSKMRKSEDGAFVERSPDGPGGYVVRHDELKQAPPIPTEPQKPDYVFRLNLRLIPAIPAPPEGKKAVEISLPTVEEQIFAALDTLGASGLDDTMSAILDGPLPMLKFQTFFGDDVLTANELAQRIQDMSGKELGILKAAMEARGCTTFAEALELAGQTGEYIFEPAIQGVEQAAEAELNAMLGEEDAELIMEHLDMHAYGIALLDQDNAILTHYGRLERRDGQPIQTMEQEPGMGGMEGMA